MSNANGHVIRIADSYADSGLSVIPIRADGSKAPAWPTWKEYQTRIAAPNERQRMFHGHVGIAVVAGPGDVETIDVDDDTLWAPFTELIESESPGLIASLTHVQTPRPGHHLVYRCAFTEGNQKLAERPDPTSPNGKKTTIETRGKGGYFLAPGSPAECHETGREYLHVGGPPLTRLESITEDERTILFRVARMFNELPPDEPEAPRKGNGAHRDGTAPGNDFNRRATWEEVLLPHGWVKARQVGQQQHWTRPGKTVGTSATTGLTSTAGNELLCVFSTNAHPFQIPAGKTCGTYSKFGAYALLNHNGDFAAAAKALGEQRYGNPRQRKSPGVNDGTDAQICNWTRVEVENKDAEPGEDGKKKRKTITVPMPMTDVLKTIKTATGDWPRRVGTWLFSHTGEKIDWHTKTSSTFAFLGRRAGVVRWKQGEGMVTKEEAHEALRMDATCYIGAETLPHWPAVAKIYYACTTPAPGDGTTLRALLDRFCPSTDIDRDLLLAAFVTPGWGGPPGARPAFLVTSDAGRGVGKSKNASMVGRLWDGVLDFEQNEDMVTIKQRLLSDEGLTKRVALLDNVKTLRFSWGAMEGLITNPTISGKRMFVGEGSRPNLLTWFITLNGASLSRDVAQRVVVVKIDRPTYTGNWEEDTNKFIDDNRAALLADVAAFFARKPDALKRFTRWGAWEQDVLARLPDPSEAQAVIQDRQGQVDVEAEEANVIEDFFGEQLKKFGYDPAADVVFIPTQDAARWLNWATNEKHGVTAASRIIKQMADEGQIRRLKPDPSRTNGRGFRWAGDDADVSFTLRTDLEKRIFEHMKAQKATDA